MLRVGTVSGSQKSSPQWAAFMRRMAELGYEEGKNFVFDFVPAANEEEYETGYRPLAAREPDIILATGPEIALKSALAATRTLPVVMVAIDYDPFARGYVTSLARPSGNVTGVFFQQIELAAKRIQVVRDAFPDISAATMFWDRLSADQWQAAQNVAATLGLRLSGIELREPPYDYERALGGGTIRSSRYGDRGNIAVLFPRSRAHRRLRVSASDPIYVRLPRMGGGGRPAFLRAEHHGAVRARRRVRRPDSTGGQARRFAHRATDKVRAGGKSEDGQGNRHRAVDGDPAAR